MDCRYKLRLKQTNKIMKTTIQYYMFLLTICAFSTQLHAKILTVAMQSLPIAQYKSLQAAHDAAQNGDTIYLYPGLTSFAGITVSKKIIIIGAGFTKVNDLSDYSKISGTLIFNAGSEGSMISSINGGFTINVNINDIVIQRCKVQDVNISKGVNNIRIINNYISWKVSIGEGSFSGIFNNIISNIEIWSGSALIKNNILSNNSYVMQLSSGIDVNIIDNIFLTYYGISNDRTNYSIINSPSIQPNYSTILTDWFVN